MGLKNVISSLLLTLIATTCFAQQQDTTSNVRLNPIAIKNITEEIKPERFKAVHFIAPAILIGYGFAAVYNKGALKELDVSTKAELQEDHPLFAVHVDDYAQFAPAVAVWGLNFAGVKGRHNLFDASMLYVTSAAIMGVSTHFVKRGVHRERPDNSGNNSFPSGHTASAFAAAEFLYQEFKYKSPWIGYAGYFVATATGTLRMYNNKHWFSDVVAGAGFGIASTKLSYLIYPHIKRIFTKKDVTNLSVMPYRQDGANGLMASYTF
ncbi:phosphatase PAP2 family protein [Pedobacter boryungensis]|uniref:Phosphatase PAP2 family protein n=1 Tax=Pedobacter boryungensis TaxID=869962 RepID=A0ABX2DB59_9SPHI|nr:phosphatase PAP2 family protein [Pedobacter boryungensis]NQX31288.1 phosphatase PAP2 family protein [Pedobacter boryungensis]